LEINIIILTLIASAFFSGIEIAYLTSSKLRIELLKKQGALSGRLLSRFVESPSSFLATILIGNNIALIVFGIMMSRLLEPALVQLLPLNFHSEFYLLTSQTILSTAVVLLAGEFIPKIIFRVNPDALLNFFAIPLTAVYYLLYPVVLVVQKISEFILKKIMNVDMTASKTVFTKVDLEDYVDQFVKNEQNIKEETINTEIFENVLYLPEIKARECMVPRNEIIAIDIDTTIAEAEAKFMETKLSRLLVFDETIDNIVGYVHHLSLLKRPKNIRSIIFPVEVIPESMPAKELLNLFTKKQKIIAWVVDEFGGTSGIITMEDLLEEIFGEINDEHDEEDLTEKQIDENDYVFAGRLEIDYLNEKYHLNIPEGEYETLSGYILAHHEDIPEQNEEIYIDNFKFEIAAVSDMRIETIKLKVIKK
jgi:CBS domain containing-hemolysin-like protein